MDLRSFLDQSGVRYQWLTHSPTVTSQELAQVEHVSGHAVVKPVVVEADDHYVMCALPASKRIDWDRLRNELRAQRVGLADEPKLVNLCSGCELGAEPPIGEMFGMPTMMDDSLLADKDVMFQAGTHEEAVRLSLNDFVRVSHPTIGHFALPA